MFLLKTIVEFSKFQKLKPVIFGEYKLWNNMDVEKFTTKINPGYDSLKRPGTSNSECFLCKNHIDLHVISIWNGYKVGGTTNETLIAHISCSDTFGLESVVKNTDGYYVTSRSPIRYCSKCGILIPKDISPTSISTQNDIEYFCSDKCSKPNLWQKRVRPIPYTILDKSNNLSHATCLLCNLSLKSEKEKSLYSEYTIIGLEGQVAVVCKICVEIVDLRKIEKVFENTSQETFLLVTTLRKIPTCEHCGKPTNDVTIMTDSDTKYYCSYHIDHVCYLDKRNCRELCIVCNKKDVYGKRAKYIEVKQKGVIAYHHEECQPHICSVCNNKVVSDWGFDNKNGKTVNIHKTTCEKLIPCFCCGIVDDKTVTVNRGSHADFYIRKHKECTPCVCDLCFKHIKDKPELWNKKKYHTECLAKLTCRKCKKRDGEVKNESHAVCSDSICPICAEVIGISESSAMENETYHVNCLNRTKCYLCGEDGKGKKIIDPTRNVFENRFMHDGCSSTKCTQCDKYIANAPIRTVLGKFYHGGLIPCGPICRVCKSVTDNDFTTLIQSSENFHKHMECKEEKCPICRESLGDPMGLQLISDMNGDMIEVHKDNCLTTYKCCPSTPKLNYEMYCSGRIIFRDSPDFSEYNWKQLPVEITRLLTAAWLSILYVCPKLDRNVIKKILCISLSNIPNITHMMPVIMGRFNVNKMCTKYRCVDHICVCGEQTAHHSDNIAKCHTSKNPSENRCIVIVRGLRDIMKYATKKDGNFDWPDTEADGLRDVSVAVIKAPMEVAQVCMAKINIIKDLMSMRSNISK